MQERINLAIEQDDNRPPILITNPLIIREYLLQRRQESLNDLSKNLVFNNFALLSLLTFICWISLYFLLKPIQNSINQREEFLTQASHELRTPLAILHSELSLSEDEDDIKELQKIHIESLTEIKRLQNLSNSLLDNLSSNKEKGKDSIEKVKIEEIIKNIWEQLQPINQKEISLDLRTEGNFIIKTNSQKLHQILFNLLDNALRYSKEKTKIEVEIAEKKQAVTIKNQSNKESFNPGIGLGICRQLSEEIGANLVQQITEDNIFVSQLQF